MMDICKLVQNVQNGDHESFTKLVLKYQNMSLGYAYSLTGDFRQSQDIVQDSFFVAYSRIKTLKSEGSFPSWLRGIIFRKANRYFRSYKPHVELTGQFEEGVDQLDGDLQKNQEKEILFGAIKKLPELERQVISMYYLEESSQKEVANFLGIPETIVNNKLFSARKKIKERMVKMASDTFREQRLDEEFAKNIGKIIKIQGSVIDTKITSKDELEILDVIGTKSGGKAKGYMFVAQRLKDGTLRCLSNETVKQDPAHELYFEGTQNLQNQIKEKSNDEMLSVVNAIQGKIKKEHEVQETGIKVIDFLAPMKRDGSVGIFGSHGVGRAVLAAELFERRKKLNGKQSIFFYVDQWNVLGTQDQIESGEYFKDDVQDNMQIAWIADDRGLNPFYAKDAEFLDSRIFCSPLLGLQGIWPAIDPLNSHSELLKPEIVGNDHYETAMKTLEILEKSRDLLLDAKTLEYLSLGARKQARERLENSYHEKMLTFSEEEKLIVNRGRKLQLFFSQPFAVAEEVTGMKGEDVTLKETVSCVKRILNGEFDNMDESKVTFKGVI